MGRFNGTETIVDIAGDAGSTALLATGPVVFVRGIESGLTNAGAPNALQGFEYQLVNPDGSVGPWILVPDNENTEQSEMTIGDRMVEGSARGSIIGHGPQQNGQGLPAQPASTLCNLRSATGTPTSVIIRQYY